MPAPDPNPEATYDARRSGFLDDLAGARRRSVRIGRGRLAVFGALVAAVLLFEGASSGGRQALLLAGAALVLAFMGLVVLHTRARRRERWLETRMLLCEEGVRRVRREWSDLPTVPRGTPGPHPYADDLDLFGPVSLATLLGSVATTPGSATLRDWLLSPPPPDGLGERQEAVEELAGLHDLRETLGAWGRTVGSPTPVALASLLEWAESDGTPLPGWVRAAAVVLPLITAGLAVAGILGWVDGSLWLAGVAGATALTLGWGRPVHDTFRKVSTGEVGLAHYARLFQPLSDAQFHSPLLQEAHARLTAGGLSAPAQLTRLLRWIHMSDTRRNALMYWPVQVLTLWDFHVLARLEAWRRDAGPRVRDWVRTLGDVDALGALATLRFENPHWTYPAVDDGTATLRASALVHPYLAPDVGVANDVEVGPPGTFLLVTGSNMSGKSTLLRALGVNVVLARAGGPVAARELRLPPVRLETSMRVQDSLAEGVSFFMAELTSLKEVVDAARERDDTPVLYLLDEILQGTNTAERQIAARRVIRHLLEAGAIGAVTTHDLHLADAPDLRARSRPVHFREHFSRGPAGPELTFDYRLLPGLATSTNALALMELVGLGDDSPETP